MSWKQLPFSGSIASSGGSLEEIARVVHQVLIQLSSPPTITTSAGRRCGPPAHALIRRHRARVAVQIGVEPPARRGLAEFGRALVDGWRSLLDLTAPIVVQGAA